jgi:hypothetical protein
MNVLKRGQPIIRQRDRQSAGEAIECRRIEVAGWIYRPPSGTGDVSRVEDGSGKSPLTLIQEEALDLGFPDSVVSDWLSRDCLIVRA